jgi:1-acyl-sn-glycerol-3-phosphate acyltransferase
MQNITRIVEDIIEIGDGIPRWHNRFLCWVGRSILRVAGWRLQVRLPDLPRFVIIAAPHTSNWDFVFGMAAVLALQIRLHWYGKHTLFRGPLGALMRWLGGMPVDRSASGGVVQQAADAFAAHPQWVLALAPEGTRALQPKWKRGFYHIALTAQVPVVVAYIDFARREIGTGPIFVPGGNWDADMRPVFDFYRSVKARRPNLFAVETIIDPDS